MPRVRNHFKSAVWKLIELTEDEKHFICKCCNKTYSRGGIQKKGFGTSNASRHLEKFHKIEYAKAKEEFQMEESLRKKKERKVDEYLKTTKASTSALELPNSSSDTDITEILSPTPMVQKTLFETLESKKIWSVSDARSKEIHLLVGQMIALDCQPISIVEDEGFNELMKRVKPNYKLPSRSYMSEKVIPCMYSTSLNFLCDVVAKCSAISFSTDIWSTGKNMFISLTGHCVYPNFDQQAVLLHTAPFLDNHTGVNISDLIKSMVETYKIPENKIHQIVHDNATNMICGVELTGYNSLTCFLHTTQLGINECIFNQAYVKRIIDKCKRIAEHFNKSGLGKQTLIAIQKQINQPVLAVKQDVITRWDSTYYMLQRMYAIKDSIVLYASNSSNNCPYIFDSDEWQIMKKVVDLLKVFHNITIR